MSISLTLSTWVFISFMHLINGAKFLNITSLLALFASASFATVFVNVIVPLTSTYASLSSHELDFRIAISNLI